MSGTKLFGYWISVQDEASARDAVRMSGLPVLLMGANAALFALVTSVRPVSNPILLVSSVAIAFLLVLLAFRIRAGHAAWIPFVLILFAAFLGVSGFSSYSLWRLAGKTQTSGAHLVLSWIIPIICLVLVIGGFRGWRWLKSRQIGVSF